MNTLLVLAVILFFLMVVFGGQQGLKAFVGLLINFAAIFVMIILMNWQFNPYLVIVIISTIILAVAIYLSTDHAEITTTAFVTSVVVMLGLMLLACLAQHLAAFQGFAVENAEELEGLSLNVGLSFAHITVATVVISALGAVAEAAMAIVADLYEVIDETPELTVASLSHHARVIGGQILGTALNTLFFGILGANLPLLIWFLRLRYTWAAFLNSKILISACVTMLIGMLGIALSIWLASVVVIRRFQRR